MGQPNRARVLAYEIGMEGVLEDNLAYNGVPSSSNDVNRGAWIVAHKGTI